MATLPGSLLVLTIDEGIKDQIQEAVILFNKRFIFRIGPKARLEARTLLVSAYDIADFFRYIHRTSDNELAVFRLRRQAEAQVSGMENDELILSCLRNIHWNQPDL